MSQDAIWDHFQNEGVAAFSQAGPRVEFLVKRLMPGEKVLDIGVGSGALVSSAHRKGIEVWALDPSLRSIEKLRTALNMSERAQVGYSQNIPFGDEQFDAVIMTEVLEHLDDETRNKTLREIYRVLRSGGRFIGTVPAREKLEQAEVVCPNCNHHFHRWGHQVSFDVRSMYDFLGQVFIVETVHERFFNDWISAQLTRRLTGIVKKFLSWRGLGTYGQARNIYFVARKPS